MNGNKHHNKPVEKILVHPVVFPASLRDSISKRGKAGFTGINTKWK
jgi:hypothetical protein